MVEHLLVRTGRQWLGVGLLLWLAGKFATARHGVVGVRHGRPVVGRRGNEGELVRPLAHQELVSARHRPRAPGWRMRRGACPLRRRGAWRAPHPELVVEPVEEALCT